MTPHKLAELEALLAEAPRLRGSYVWRGDEYDIPGTLVVDNDESAGWWERIDAEKAALEALLKDGSALCAALREAWEEKAVLENTIVQLRFMLGSAALEDSE